MAAGRNNLLKLKELLGLFTVWYEGREVLFMMDVSLVNMLLSATFETELNGQARTKLALLI